MIADIILSFNGRGMDKPVIFNRRLCLTNFIEFFEEATRRGNEGRAFDVVYKYFSKAFGKKKSHGFPSSMAHW